MPRGPSPPGDSRVWKWSLKTSHHMWHETICVKFKNCHSHLKTWIRKKKSLLWMESRYGWNRIQENFLDSRDFLFLSGAVIHLYVDYQSLHKAYTLKRYFLHPCALKKSLLFKGWLLNLLSHNKLWNLEGLQCRATVLRNLGQGTQNLCKDVRMAC